MPLAAAVSYITLMSPRTTTKRRGTASLLAVKKGGGVVFRERIKWRKK